MKDWLLKQVVATFDPKTPEECILIGYIEEEISRPVEPVAYLKSVQLDHNDFELCISSEWNNSAFPVFTHPPAKPVLLSANCVWDAYAKSTLQVMNSEQDDIHSFALELEKAVLKANGLGGVE